MTQNIIFKETIGKLEDKCVDEDNIENPLTPIDIINYDTMTTDQMVWLWLAVQYGNSGVVIGGTASGKSSTLNASSMFTEPSSDFVIVDEVRDDAKSIFQLMDDGHTVYTTFYSNNVNEFETRMTGDRINVDIKRLNSIDFVVNQNKLFDGRRVMKEVREINRRGDHLVNKLITDFNYESREFNDVKWSESKIIQDIKKQNNWSDEELQEEIEQRKELLQYINDNVERFDDLYIDEQRRRFKKIKLVIKLYMNDPEILQKLKEEDMLFGDDIIDTLLDIQE
jgi:flagellar protein FlaI